MKRSLNFLVLSFATTATFAQGLVNFQNTPATLVSVGLAGQLINASPGSYYFGLLTSTSSTVNGDYSFAGVYATNLAVAGLFSGGADVAVPGWQSGTLRYYLIAGWSADLGHDWNPAWLSGVFPFAQSNSVFGVSGAGLTIAGAASPADLFAPGNGLFPIQTGFELFPVGVPEPSTGALATLGLTVATLTLRGRGRKRIPGGRVGSRPPNCKGPLPGVAHPGCHKGG